MNELFDKLILRAFLTAFICLLLWGYKYLHYILYPAGVDQIRASFSPIKNPSDTVHLFARIAGLGIIFSEFQFYLSDGVFYAAMEFFVHSLSAYALFLLSAWILDSISLYNFDYADEVLKRRNMAYSTVSAAHVLGVAYLIKVILQVSQGSFVALVFLWLLAIIIPGIAAKFYSWASLLAFNKNIIQKNMGIAFSYSGFIWGWCFVIGTALDSDAKSFRWYFISVILQILLALIIYPLFKKGLNYIFRIVHDVEKETREDDQKKDSELNFAFGFYEGATFLASCLLTSIIIGQIHFGTFYPTF